MIHGSTLYEYQMLPTSQLPIVTNLSSKQVTVFVDFDVSHYDKLKLMQFYRVYQETKDRKHI